MTQFNDREQAFENKFGHDEELEFKILSRMARLFGLWAAGQLGLTDAEAETYADDAMSIEIAKTGRAGLITKIEKDFAARKFSISRHRLEREMESCYVEARGQVAGTRETG